MLRNLILLVIAFVFALVGSVVFVYPDCKNGRLVADVVRLDKGHTEGLEAKVTEDLIKLMLSGRGGKLQQITTMSASTQENADRNHRGKVYPRLRNRSDP
jgi:hypothetical protein